LYERDVEIAELKGKIEEKEREHREEIERMKVEMD